jgi:chromosome segregation ATPase
MDLNYDNLKSFFDRIKSLTFWQRVFYWSTLKSLSYEAYEEFKSIADNLNTLNQNVTEKDSRISDQEKNIQILSARVSDLTTSNQKLEARISSLESDVKRVNYEKSELVNKVTRFEQTEQSRLEEFQKNVSGVNAVRTGLENDRQKINDEKIKEKTEEFERLKQTWHNHEENVKTVIKKICQSQLIDYVKDVPFKGKPDNTINIAGEYVIFDAKSPARDDLENFPK